MGGLLIFLVVGLLGGGAALYYVKFMKPKQNVKGSTDLDEFDFDEFTQLHFTVPLSSWICLYTSYNEPK